MMRHYRNPATRRDRRATRAPRRPDPTPPTRQPVQQCVMAAIQRGDMDTAMYGCDFDARNRG